MNSAAANTKGLEVYGYLRNSLLDKDKHTVGPSLSGQNHSRDRVSTR
jgi:hypothetical protein